MTWIRRAMLVLASGALLSLVALTVVVDDPARRVDLRQYLAPLRGLDLPRPAAPPVSPEPPEPCATDEANPWATGPLTEAELALLARRRWTEWREPLGDAPLPRTEQAVADQANAAFEPVYARIPAFLDWHYSVAGQYTQLAESILDALAESQLAQAAFERLANSQLGQAVIDRLAGSELAQAAFERLPDTQRVREAVQQLQQGIDARLFSDLPDRIEDASAHVETVLREEMGARIGQRIHAELQTLPPPASAPPAADGTPCPETGSADIRLVYERMLRTTTPRALRRFTDSAAPTGIIALGAGAGGALTGRALVRRLSGRLLSRTASAAARTIGTAVGGLTAGAAAWMLVDLAVLFLDEHFHRDDLERELTALVDEQKEAVRAALSQAVEEARSDALGEVTPAEMGNRDRRDR